MENSGEWISYIRESLESIDQDWAKELIGLVLSWDARSDRGSKAGLVWLRYMDNSSLKYIRTKTRTYFQGLSSRYNSFESTVFSNMYKSLLYAQLTRDEQHILFQMNGKFAECLKKIYLPKINEFNSIENFDPSEFIDALVLDVDSYIVLLIEIMPKFYPQIVHNVNSLEPIIRNSMISGELYDFLIKAFVEAYRIENQVFKQRLDKFRNISFTEIGYGEELSLNNGVGYGTAIAGLQKLVTSKKLVEILDIIGFLEHDISHAIDEFYPEGSYSLTTDDLIPIFIMLLTRSQISVLPAYLKFMKKIGRAEIFPVELSYLVQILETGIESLNNLT